MTVSPEDLNRYEREALIFYYMWFFFYLFLGISSIVLPALAAMGIAFGIPDGEKYLAGLGALAAAIFGFAKPNEYAAAFDTAIADLRSLRIRLSDLAPAEVANRLDAIFHSMAFKYQGSPPSQQGKHDGT